MTPGRGSLNRKRAVVVGGYGGLGRAICGVLAGDGAHVAVAGRSGDRALEVSAHMAEYGSPTMACDVDVTDRDSVNRLIEKVTRQWSGIDVLVNCASTLVDGPAEKVTQTDWDNVVEANLSGAFWLSQAAGRAMIATGAGGRIVHLSSVRSQAGAPRGFAAYGATKAGLNLLVKQLATEWGRYQITVNAVAPGFVRTDMVAAASEDSQFMQMIINRTPLGRIAEANDIAEAVRYLASPVAAFVTGQILFVDGGVTASQ